MLLLPSISISKWLPLYVLRAGHAINGVGEGAVAVVGEYERRRTGLRDSNVFPSLP